MFECIQGEGGVNDLDYDFVKAIEKIAKEKDILMVIDEVQTGNGRTGKYFAYEHFDINPDIVSTAKGLAGGLPMGAVIFGEKVADCVTPSSHGSTFGGNPIVAAGAISIVERIDESFLNDVNEKSKYIIDYLSKIKGVKSISGKGLMLGILTEKNASEIAKACLENGLLVLTAHKNKVRLLPALNISYDEINEGLKILKEVIEK
jgi:acetylornithine/N-succinyldiaminopimelate aminotransferase